MGRDAEGAGEAIRAESDEDNGPSTTCWAST